MCRGTVLITPNFPSDEQKRLETLRSLAVLDTPPEERFDRLTRMAKRLFDVPIALVSLIDENRQWFKSCVGIDASETPRDISFCGHAILSDEILVVPNALLDTRFADNPLVTGDPNIRFYAGRPLKAPNGSRLGTLCIIDRQPRNLSQEDLNVLSDLASIVERELSVIQLATMDDLTCILNRRGFMLLAGHSLNVCIRQNLPASLVFMDLDNFKSVNDTLGHAEGDRALAVFSEHLKRVFRESDVVARLGGDEFAVLLSNSKKIEAEEILKRLYEALDNINREENNGYDILFSHGVVEFDQDRHSAIDILLAECDALMYEVKKAKR